MKYINFILLLLFFYACSNTPDVRPNIVARPDVNLDTIFVAYQKYQGPLFPIDFKKKIPPKYLSADLAVLEVALYEAQTSLLRYASKDEVNSAFNKAFQETTDSMYYLDFVKSIARLQNVIACGHSGWSHTPSYFPYRNSNVKLFPFDLTIIEGRYFIKHNNSLNRNVKPGTEILSINNQSVKEITKDLRSHMMVDGKSGLEGFKGITPYFPNAYSNFIENPQTFNLDIITPEKTESKIQIDPLLKSDIDSIRNHYYRPSQVGIPLRLDVIDSINTAIYTIKWFRNEYIESYGQNFHQFNDSVFDGLRQNGIDNLIIDLRGNTGGWTANGKRLLEYLIEDTIPYINKVIVKKPDNYSFAAIVKHAPGYNDTILLEQNSHGLYEWANYPSLFAYPVPNNSFTGKCYVLIDDMSRSCSAAFCAMAQDHTNAIFIGSETGGAKCGSNAMVMSIQLPYTGVIINFSTAEYHYNVIDTNNTRGIRPNHPIKQKIGSEDESLKKALQLISKSN